MKYQANPVIVDAFKIVAIGNNCERKNRQPHEPISGIFLTLENGQEVYPARELMSRMTPSVGDYWVIQADGYVYLNPADVFERKYGPVEPNALELGAAARKAGIAR